MKLFHNIVRYFNVIWVICGEITYTSNIYEIDAVIITFELFSKNIIDKFRNLANKVTRTILRFFQTLSMLNMVLGR